MDKMDRATRGPQSYDPAAIADCYEAMEQLPVANCLLTDCPKREVLQANTKFYQLIGYSKGEFQYRYGSRMSAILVGTWPSFRFNKSVEEVELESCLVMDGRADRWLRVNARPVVIDGEALVFCIITDITYEKQTAANLADYKNVFERATLLTGSETFSYDICTQRAKIYRNGVILEQISCKDQEQYGSFQQAILAKGLVDRVDEAAFVNAFLSIRRKEAAVCEIRMHTSQGKQQWVRLSFELKEHSSGRCGTAIGILQDITELKAANLHCLGEAQFLQAILSEKDAYIQADITTDKMLRVGGRWLLYSGLMYSTGYNNLIKQHMSQTIHPEDISYYLEFMSPDNLCQSLSNGINQLSCRVRRIFGQEDANWIEIKAFLFQNPFSHDTEALICSEQLNKNVASMIVSDEAHSNSLQDPASPQLPIIADHEFQQFLYENGDIAYLVDRDSYELLAGNEALFRRVGLTQRECYGRTCYSVMHHRTSPCPFCGRGNWSKDRFYVWKNWNAVLQQDFLIKNRIVSWKKHDVLLAIAVEVPANKWFLDSLADGGGESHSVLAGVQRMSEATTLDETIHNALETIGNFFSAGAVQYWAYHAADETFSCLHEWKRNSTFLDDPANQRVVHAVNQWVHKLRWTYPVNIENQEAMLCHSFEMYELLKASGIWNQRWIPLREEDTLWGILVIMNISNHFQNDSFLNTLSVFMMEEWRNKAKIDELIYASNHDELTGFPNRKSFDLCMQRYSSENVSTLGVLSAHINDLDEINKQQTFQGGDDCVRHFASKLQSAFSEGQIFRLNGGDFIVILEDFSREKLSARLEEMEDEIVSCRRYTISTGYSWDNIEKELPLLFQQAAQSMKLNIQQQNDSASESIDEDRQLMIQKLMGTLKRKEFEVFLQPKVNLFTGKLMGAEALVRYREKDNRIIPPSHFIGVLEKNNLIRFVDFYVFEECCRVLENWKSRGMHLPVISFNFSRLTLMERDIVSSVQAIFGKYQIPKDKVEIEITESVADLGKGTLYQAAHDLYQEGFSISLDDFGTKYTNLDILSELDFDMLKVDKSLVSLLTKRRSNQIILQNIITMCKHLNISVIAEGIETKAQEEVLRSLGCKYGQGYLYGRPMPIHEFEKLFMGGSFVSDSIS